MGNEHCAAGSGFWLKPRFVQQLCRVRHCDFALGNRAMGQNRSANPGLDDGRFSAFPAQFFTVTLGSGFILVALLFDWGGLLLVFAIIIWSVLQERRWLRQYGHAGRGSNTQSRLGKRSPSANSAEPPAPAASALPFCLTTLLNRWLARESACRKLLFAVQPSGLHQTPLEAVPG